MAMNTAYEAYKKAIVNMLKVSKHLMAGDKLFDNLIIWKIYRSSYETDFQSMGKIVNSITVLASSQQNGKLQII